MNAKHTPGPWRYVRANQSPTTGEHMISGALPGYLAEIRDCGSGDVKANARLIAAAPELLAALQEFERYAEPMITASYGREVIGRVRAAIAKALGE